jgi:hypothetical protein
VRHWLIPVLALGLLCAGAPPVEFVPVQPRFAGAADEYRRLWDAEGARIVAALETATGMRFPAASVEVIVSDGPPMTGYDGRSMRLRAGYSPSYKRATLVHELGHLLTLELPRTAELDDHRLLYLFLYDVWNDLYGQAFADRMVRIERRITGLYDYDAAWSWALSLTREQRQARLAAVRAQAGASRRAEPSAAAPPFLGYDPEAFPRR